MKERSHKDRYQEVLASSVGHFFYCQDSFSSRGNCTAVTGLSKGPALNTCEHTAHDMSHRTQMEQKAKKVYKKVKNRQYSHELPRN